MVAGDPRPDFASRLPRPFAARCAWVIRAISAWDCLFRSSSAPRERQCDVIDRFIGLAQMFFDNLELTLVCSINASRVLEVQQLKGVTTMIYMLFLSTDHASPPSLATKQLTYGKSTTSEHEA